MWLGGEIGVGPGAREQVGQRTGAGMAQIVRDLLQARRGVLFDKRQKLGEGFEEYRMGGDDIFHAQESAGRRLDRRRSLP